jgi:hypothetical protein
MPKKKAPVIGGPFDGDVWEITPGKKNYNRGDHRYHLSLVDEKKQLKPRFLYKGQTPEENSK